MFVSGSAALFQFCDSCVQEMLVSQFKSGKPTAQFKVNQAILCAFVCVRPKQWLHFIIMFV